MAFRVPRFNVWCQVRRATSGNPDLIAGWSICQVRGSASAQDPEFDNVGAFQILFPKHSDIRGPMHSEDGLGDWVQIAGWGRRYAVVTSVSDKGCGFTNEYRIAIVHWLAYASSPLNDVLGCGAIDTELLPPEDYLELPLIEKLPWAFVP